MTNNNIKITHAIIDTSVLYKFNFDFIGIYSNRLISFFETLKQKNITLLTHPILENEIYNNILESHITKKYNDLTNSLKKSEKILLRYLDSKEFEKISSAIDEIDIRKRIYEEFKNIYNDALRLDYVDSSLIFDLYFNSKPPFSTNEDKKHEFPDAFIVESVKQFLNVNNDSVVMVISADGDWEKSFCSQKNVLFFKGIGPANDAVLNYFSEIDDNFIDSVFQSAKDDISDEICNMAEYEPYSFSSYEFIEDFTVDKIEFSSFDKKYSVINKTNSYITYEITADILVTGTGVIIDELNSIYDKELNDYTYVSYSILEADQALVTIKSEIEIEYDPTIFISRAIIANYGTIMLDGNIVKLSPFNAEEYYK